MNTEVNESFLLMQMIANEFTRKLELCIRNRNPVNPLYWVVRKVMRCIVIYLIQCSVEQREDLSQECIDHHGLPSLSNVEAESGCRLCKMKVAEMKRNFELHLRLRSGCQTFFSLK